MRHLLSLLVGVILTLGCSSLHSNSPSGSSVEYTNNPAPTGMMKFEIPVWIDKNFSFDHRSSIHAALADWNTVFNGYGKYTVVSDSYDMEPEVLVQLEATHQGLVILANKTTDDQVQAMEDGVLAWVPDLGAPFIHIVDDRIGTRDLKSITLHEIGHTLGLEHTSIKHTLMFPYINVGSPCVDKVTVLQLASDSYDLNWKNLNWCSFE